MKLSIGSYLYFFNMGKMVTAGLGACVPPECTPEAMQEFADSYMKPSI